MPQMEIHYEEEWAALYVDGRLDRVGDSYLAEERVMELCGVRVVQDDAFMRGQKQASGVAQTLQELEAYVRDRDAARARVAELEAQAAELRRQAAEVCA